jgi:hypothetical protein
LNQPFVHLSIRWVCGQGLASARTLPGPAFA